VGYLVSNYEDFDYGDLTFYDDLSDAIADAQYMLNNEVADTMYIFEVTINKTMVLCA
jgi:hypothetical protein